MAGRKDPWVRWFDVTNPQKHTGGYTVYKVTSKVHEYLQVQHVTHDAINNGPTYNYYY